MKHPFCEKCGSDVQKGMWVNFWDTRSSSTDRHAKCGTHPKNQKINELIEEMQRLEKELDEEQREASKMLEPQYHREAHVKISEGGRHNKIPEGEEYIFFVSNLLNKSDYENHLKIYGSLSGGTPDETTSSVAYYRKHGILFHDGGGWLILEDEQPCSDAEWESLKTGDILDTFIKRRKW